MKKWVIGFGVLLLFFIFFLLCSKEREQEVILYAWNIDDVMSNKEMFNTIREKYQVNTLYQDFNENFFKNPNTPFMDYMKSLSIDVYHLGGDPSWGNKGGYVKIKKEINRVYDYNQKHNVKIKGVVLDIEPYVSEKKEKFLTEDFFVFVSEIKKAYSYAQSKKIPMRLTIPYWFDYINLDLLEELIKNCDGISVMNYDIKKTLVSIQDEYRLAEKYHKKIDTIYEIHYGEKDYFPSLNAIMNDYNLLRKEYSKLSISYHHLKSIKNALSTYE